jgi:VCBS repeat-containing protein
MTTRSWIRKLFSRDAAPTIVRTPAARARLGLENLETREVPTAVTNAPPVAVADTFAATEDSILVGNVLTNDYDPEGRPLTAALASGPAHGTLFFNHGGNGQFVYVPHANFTGTDTFTYRNGDGQFLSLDQTVTINVANVNDAPVAVADAYTMPEDGTLTANVLANDTDVDGPSLNAALRSQPAHGTVVMNANGSFTYKPHANFVGTDSFTYRNGDWSLLSNDTTVSITVTPVNDAPVALADVFAVRVGGVLEGSVLANDWDAEGNALNAAVRVQPLHGRVVLNPNGSFLYMPDAGFTGTDTFTYRNGDGSLLSNDTTVTITVTPVNDLALMQEKFDANLALLQDLLRSFEDAQNTIIRNL